MRTRTLFLTSVAALAIAVASCTTEEYPETLLYEMSFTATRGQEANSETRTVLGDDGAVLWSPSDEVSVFNGTGSSGGNKFKSQNNAPAATVEFKGYLEGLSGIQSGQYFWAIYPYSSFNSCDGQSITSALPANQTAVKGSFAKGCHPAMARTTDTRLAFYSIAGGLEFTVTRPGIKSISIRGNNHEYLAGIFEATFGSDGKPAIQVITGHEEVTLSATNGSAFIPGERYMISLFPAVLSEGITLTLYTDDNKKGTIISSKPQTVKRSVFGRIQNVDERVTDWEDLPFEAEGGGTKSGLYLGIIGFNQELYKMDVQRLDYSTKELFDSFVDGLIIKNGTLLYYSVDEAIRTLQKAQYPDDLFSVSLITFTDGLDQGSSMMIEGYPGDNEYLEILHDRLYSSSVAGQPLSAYSVGLKGDDVTEVDLFSSNLRMLSCPESNAYEVSDMSSVNSRFQEVAEQVNNACQTIKYDLKLSIPGQANGTRVRFTLDGEDAQYSSMFIEGVFNLADKALTDVSYKGISCSSRATINGEVSGIFVSFTFKDVVTEYSKAINPSDVCHWSYVNSSGKWQKNSEFDTDNDVTVTVTRTKKTAVVLLNLDCSKSLGIQFATLKSLVKSFIAKLYDAAVDPSEVSGVSLDRAEVDMIKGGSTTLSAVVSPSTATNQSVQWLSSDPSTAAVDQEGRVIGINEGTAVITVTTVDGGYTASCRINVLENTTEAVDLGLSVLWASFNVGATHPEEYGLYFSWGETIPKTNYNRNTYKFDLGSDSYAGPFWKYGNDDNKVVLDPEDDAAGVNWGGTWRMPTEEEWTELRENSTTTWTTENGINGRRVTSNKDGYTDKSIFLPAAGYMHGTGLCRGGDVGYYWSSEVTPNMLFDSKGAAFDKDTFYGGLTTMRLYGLPVRPVTFCNVSEVCFDRNELTLIEGGKCRLYVTVLPNAAQDKSVRLVSSNPTVAKIDQEGMVYGLLEGSAVITVTTNDGGHTASCLVNVLEKPHTEAVDLGLSVKWATFNVGATKPEEYGDYFAWGETAAKDEYTVRNYKWCNRSLKSLIKYNTSSSIGVVDDLTILDLEDDAAYMNWGGQWRTPTDEEWTELRSKCTWVLTTENGVVGYRVYSTIENSTDNSVFLPASGYISGTFKWWFGSSGCYWSSSLDTSHPVTAPYTIFTETGVGRMGMDRTSGLTIRPVSE